MTHKAKLLLVLLSSIACNIAWAAGPEVDLSETEFLNDLPMVYSASRLPQLPQDAAGATTILDRDIIRASGARDVTDLLRLVPGFQVGVNAGGRPVVSYHGLSGQISQRMQVYVDGRSLYAPYLFGGVDWSALSVPIDEIERIEVQRGSNSVTYGANAFLGVIQIITRAAAQSVGTYAQIAQGSQGIADRSLRVGDRLANAQWRIAAGTKSDNGLDGRLDGYGTSYIDLRAEVQPSMTQEWVFFAGMTKSIFGSGFEKLATDPLRQEVTESSFFNLRYRHSVDADQEWSLSASHTADGGRDSFTIPLLNADSILVDNGRKAFRNVLGYQHFKSIGHQLRASWGLEYGSEELIAKQLFNTAEPQINDSWRAYVNQEWQPDKRWTVNAGALLEGNRLTPTQLAPRLSINWKSGTDQALKLGYSSAFRTPSLFEQRANWRTEYAGETVNVRYLSTGGLVPERINATDLVYTGHQRERGLTWDMRLFHEDISQLISGELYLLPPGQSYTSNAVAYDLKNNASVTSDGLEFQLTWRPGFDTMLAWSQYKASPQAEKAFVQASIPESGLSLMASHMWRNGLSTSVSYHETSPVLYLGEANMAGRQRFMAAKLTQNLRLSKVNTQLSVQWRKPLDHWDEFREQQSLSEQLWLSVSFQY